VWALAVGACASLRLGAPVSEACAGTATAPIARTIVAPLTANS
jgi:hypothetical protein